MSNHQEVATKISEALKAAAQCSAAETVENYSVLSEQLWELNSLHTISRGAITLAKVLRDRLVVRRVNERERDAAMFAIDREIGIERQYGVPLIDFGHPHDTCIGERHRSVPIFLMQLAQGGDVLVGRRGIVK